MNSKWEWCYSHHEYEDASGEIYLMCFECKHVYRTAEDLVNAYNREATVMADRWAGLLVGAAPPPVRNLGPDQADLIGFCQFCLHDF